MKKSVILALVVAAAFGAPQVTHAQGTATPAGEGRFYIELKDAPLSDALEMIFKAAGVPSFSIADEAKAINIAPTTFQNMAWNTAVMNLTRQNGFLLRRDPATGAYIVEARQPAPGMGDNPFASPMGGMPSNPFGGGRPGFNRPTLNGTAPITRTAPQTRPTTRGGRNAAPEATPSTPRDPNAVYRILPVQHVYVGGIARLFEKSQIIDSTGFLVPQSNGGFGGMGGGMGGMGMGGMGMGGMGMGGMGMGGMGMGGMGMGGMGMGGMGMGGMGMGGMGMGGIGGGIGMGGIGGIGMGGF